MKRVLIFTIVAALLLTPLDALQVYFGVRTLGTDPWLTPIKFALVGLLLGLLSFSLDPKPHPSKIKAVVLHGMFFTFAYITTFFVDDPGLCLTALAVNLIIQFIISMYLFRINFFEVLPFMLTLGLIGPTLEYVDIKLGGFQYTSSPNTIPTWLPFLWASGSFMTRALTGEEKGQLPSTQTLFNWVVWIITPFAKFVAMLFYALNYKNIKRLGFFGSFKMAFRD